MRVLVLVLGVLAGLAPRPVAAQIFHSTQTANLQTTETLRRGNWLFEISHRFVPPVSDGVDALWGIDGPVFNRLGLTYAPADGLLIGVQRTNLNDNVELNGKALLFEQETEGLSLDIGVMTGIAWNTDVFEVAGAEDNESQFYGQLLIDVLIGDRFAVGVVPSYLRNPRLLDVDPANALSVGVHGQYYLTGAMSVLGEWIFSEERPGLENDSGTFGVELQTRGHFFKLLVTNQYMMNPTQYLAGAADSFGFDELRFGFNLTRLLPF